MSDPRTEKPAPRDGEESDFGSKLKVRLAIAAVLVALALAAIPVLDTLTGKKSDSADTTSNIGGLPSSAPLGATPDATAAGLVASAPAAAASAPAVASQPASNAPTGPNLSQTPGMTAEPPLTIPATGTAAPPPAAQHHTTAPAPALSHPATQATVATARDTSKAHSQSYAPQPYAQHQPAANAPEAGNFQPVVPQAIQPLSPQEVATLPARPAGSSVGYNVQLGLFSNMGNAQKLIAELKSKGIEVQSETRIHLAPFRTRAEAEQAMAKLRAMGYAPLLNAAGN